MLVGRGMTLGFHSWSFKHSEYPKDGYMAVGSFLFLKEQIKGIIIIRVSKTVTRPWLTAMTINNPV
jgi:hypothetical protein